MNSKALSQSYLKVKILNEEEEECLLEICSGDNSKREVVDEDGKAEEGAKLNEKEEEEEKEKEVEEQLYEEIEEDKEREREKEGRMEEASKDEKNENIVNSLKQEKTEEQREGEIKKKAMMKESNKEIMTEESREADTEKYASLAMPEVSDEESDLKDEPQHEIITVHENFEIPAPELGCKQCFQILDENMQRANGNGCEHDIRVLKDLAFDDDETAKMFDEIMYSAEKDTETSWKCGLDEPSETFRASLCSLSTCQDSLPSSRSTNKHSLTLDLECRICHDTEGQDLISPCHCAGTSKWVHESCIIRWIRHTKTKQCEICTCPIAVKRRKKPIEQWTRPSASCGPCNRLDIWYCFVVALCVFIIIGFVVLQNRYDVTEQIETTVIFASIYVLCGMIIMMKLRYFWTWFVQRSSFWGNWKNLNEEWRIIEANEPNINSPQSPV